MKFLLKMISKIDLSSKWIIPMEKIQVLVVLILLTFVFPRELVADKKNFVIRWKEVPGNNGYVVKIQNSKSKQEEHATNSNSVNLPLEPGQYTIQVAAKNRFGKPGKFSDAKIIQIQESSSQNEIDLSDESKSKANSKKSYNTNLELDSFQNWIPGYVQYKKSNYLDAGLYWITIPTFAYIGYSEKLRGDAIAKDVWNEPTNLFFLLQNRSTLEVFYFRNRRDQEKVKYDSAQNNQKYMASGLLIFYAIHWADLYFFNGEGIIKSFSSSHMEQANLGLDIFTGVEFQWKFDTSQ